MPDKPKKGWTRVAFGDVVQLCRERSSNPVGDGFDRYVGLEHLDPGDLKIRRWGNIEDGTTFTSVFRAGQVLFGKRRAYQRKVAVPDFDGVCSGDIYVLKPQDDRLLPELLPFICQTDGFFDHAVGTSAGSLSPRTNWESLASYEFALPPMEEQRRIHDILSGSTAISERLADCISHSKQLIASIRMSAFNPSRYNPVALRDLCSDGDGIQIGPFGAQLHQSDYQDEGVPVVMPINMRSDKIDCDGIARVSEEKAQSLSVHRIRPGDILLPRRGELDRRAYVDEEAADWLCGTGSIRIRVHSNVPALAVFHSLASQYCVNWLNTHAVGTTMPNLNTRIVGNIPIALPPVEVLGKFVVVLQVFDKVLADLRKRMLTVRSLTEQVLTGAFGGVV